MVGLIYNEKVNITFALALSFLAGISTILGGIFYSQFQTANKKLFSFFLGVSAGAMVAISLFDLLPTSVKGLGLITSLGLMGVGAIIARLVDLAAPHHISLPITCTIKEKKMMTTGITVAIGMIIHNIPEGMAVFMASLHNVRFGLVLAIATAIHNIPEGIAVTAPILCATKNKQLAFRYTLIAGLAEPFGALITFLLLRPYLSADVLSGSFAVVAGIMLFISIDELLPWCFKDKHYTQALSGIMTGICVLGISAWFIK